MSGEEHLDIPTRRPLRGAVAAGIVAVVLVGAVSLGVAFLLRGSGVTAPDLRGLTAREAAAAAEEAGVGFLARGASDSTTALVVAQEPLPGAQMGRGDVVRVDLAVPPALVRVPDTVGLTTEEARAVIAEAGLRPGALREDPAAGAPPGVVTRQEPAAGAEVPEGASVALWVAGAPTALVPDLSGLTRDEAEAAAAAAQVSVRFLAEVTDEVLSGLVFRQSPQAGARVSPGTQIVAVINAGSADPVPGSSGDTGGEGAPPAPSAVFEVLARAYPFPVLYPTFLPPGLALETGPDNPGHRTGPAGTQGFEVTFKAVEDPGRTLTLLQGDWFDPGLEQPTLIDIRGTVANLDESAGTIILVWSENDTRYAVAAVGMPRHDVMAVAAGLRPLTE